MQVKINVLPQFFRHFQFVFTYILLAKNFRTQKISDTIICNLLIQIFEKREHSNHYTLRYNASKSKIARGMPQSEQILDWQSVSEKKENDTSH